MRVRKPLGILPTSRPQLLGAAKRGGPVTFSSSEKLVFGVADTGEFWPYIGNVEGAVEGRLPISSRANVTIETGQTFQLGDILVRPGVGIAMVLISPDSFDFGSGYGGVVMFARARYVRIGSIYEDVSPLLEHLAHKGEEIDYAFYNLPQPPSPDAAGSMKFAGADLRKR